VVVLEEQPPEDGDVIIADPDEGEDLPTVSDVVEEVAPVGTTIDPEAPIVRPCSPQSHAIVPVPKVVVPDTFGEKALKLVSRAADSLGMTMPRKMEYIVLAHVHDEECTRMEAGFGIYRWLRKKSILLRPLAELWGFFVSWIHMPVWWWNGMMLCLFGRFKRPIRLLGLVIPVAIHMLFLVYSLLEFDSDTLFSKWYLIGMGLAFLYDFYFYNNAIHVCNRIDDLQEAAYAHEPLPPIRDRLWANKWTDLYEEAFGVLPLEDGIQTRMIKQ